jgi:eukaryotic-like serine/threonine-protein kinase
VKIGRYQILDEVGRGAMGIVYRAHDPNLDIIVALKVLRKERLTSEPFVRRFMAEARVLGRLDHPEIVRVFNVDRDGDDVYIAMEFIDGEPLSELMKKKSHCPEVIADFGVHMAEALDYAHKKGVIHRDVKPSNILSMPGGRLKITDFGIAHIEDPSRAEETQVGEILGTPAYMSPEQVLGRAVDGRSDLFSLGIILYEMAAGQRPFQGQGMNAIFQAIANDVPAPVHASNAEISPALAAAIMKSLGKSPEARYADCAALAAALRLTVADAGPVNPGRAGSVGKYRPELASRWRLPVWGRVLAGGLAAVCLLVLFLGRSVAPLGQAPAQVPAQESAGAPQLAVGKQVAAGQHSRLQAESTPPGATLRVDGVVLGVTPQTVALAPGKHEVVLSLAGHEPWEAQVELEKDKETPVSATLVAKGR